MELIAIIGLVVLGIALIAVEVFFIPGTTVVGVLGFLTCAAGVYFAYTDLGSITGHVLLAVSVVGPISMFYLGVKFEVWNIFSLKESVDGHASKDSDKLKLEKGMRGMSVSVIKPFGSAEFEDQIVEVSSMGEYIESQIEIEIIRISDGKIFVQPI